MGGLPHTPALMPYLDLRKEGHALHSLAYLRAAYALTVSGRSTL
jgi:hypothetical protein